MNDFERKGGNPIHMLIDIFVDSAAGIESSDSDQDPPSQIKRKLQKFYRKKTEGIMNKILQEQQ